MHRATQFRCPPPGARDSGRADAGQLLSRETLSLPPTPAIPSAPLSTTVSASSCRTISARRPNFTLNLGLRWEYFGPISESHNLFSNLGADGNLALVGTDGVNGAYKPRPQQLRPAHRLLPGMFDTEDGRSRRLRHLLRLRPAGLADRELHQLRWTRYQSHRSQAGRIAREQLRFHCFQWR